MSIRWPCFIAILLSALLAVANSASAECAWVMWGSTPDGRFLPMRAYTTYAACEQESARITKNVAEGISKGTTKPELQLYGYLCYPDTVDPRGPKGK